MLLWEFSISDAEGHNNLKDGGWNLPNRTLIAWLMGEVGNMERPSNVVFVYYWDSPYPPDQTGQMAGTTFAYHGEIAKQFDFVVGHANVAKYLDELKISSWERHFRPVLF